MRPLLSRSPPSWTALLLACCLILLSACGGGHAHPPPGATSGSLTVAIGGLPAGVAGAVTVSGPASYSKLLTATATLADLAPGAYAISAATRAQARAPSRPRP